MTASTNLDASIATELLQPSCSGKASQVEAVLAVQARSAGRRLR